MGLFDEHPDTVDCLAWAEPHIPLALKHRIEQDRAGLRLAARDIIGEGVTYARSVMLRDTTDPRLVPLIREAINWRIRNPLKEAN